MTVNIFLLIMLQHGIKNNGSVFQLKKLSFNKFQKYRRNRECSKIIPYNMVFKRFAFVLFLINKENGCMSSTAMTEVLVEQELPYLPRPRACKLRTRAFFHFHLYNVPPSSCTLSQDGRIQP